MVDDINNMYDASKENMENRENNEDNEEVSHYAVVGAVDAIIEEYVKDSYIVIAASVIGIILGAIWVSFSEMRYKSEMTGAIAIAFIVAILLVVIGSIFRHRRAKACHDRAMRKEYRLEKARVLSTGVDTEGRGVHYYAEIMFENGNPINRNMNTCKVDISRRLQKQFFADTPVYVIMWKNGTGIYDDYDIFLR